MGRANYVHDKDKLGKKMLQIREKPDSSARIWWSFQIKVSKTTLVGNFPVQQTRALRRKIALIAGSCQPPLPPLQWSSSSFMWVEVWVLVWWMWDPGGKSKDNLRHFLHGLLFLPPTPALQCAAHQRSFSLVWIFSSNTRWSTDCIWRPIGSQCTRSLDQ